MSRKADFARARALLRIGGLEGDGWDSTVDPAPDTVGAKDGAMVSTPDGSVTVWVYRLRHWDEADAVQRRVTELVADGREAVGTSNGRLLMCATADRNDLTARDRLDHLLEAFAGRE